MIPTPIATANPTKVTFLTESSSSMISFIPVIVIEPNTVIVAPPSTASGIVVIRAPTLGISPAININPAEIASTSLLTTLVVATIPTFWLYVASGSPPNIAPTILEAPLPIIPPASSSSSSSLPSPPIVVAEKSPTA